MKLDFINRPEYGDCEPIRLVLDDVEGIPAVLTRYSTKILPLRRHRHEYVQINYVLRGGARHVINGHEFEVSKGDIFIVPPYVPHSILPLPDTAAAGEGIICEFEFMPEFINSNFTDYDEARSFFDFAYIEPFLVTEAHVRPFLNLTGTLQLEVEGILDEAYAEYMEKRDGYGLIIKSLLLKLLVLVGRRYTEAIRADGSIYDRHSRAIHDVMRFAEDHYAEEIALSDAARIAMLSPSYFRNMFKGVTGKTFVEYLMQVRLAHACEMLTRTNVAITDICGEVGFNSVAHFNKSFKRTIGETPSEYRRNHENA
ncbi:MAG: AraC family transcriptional regulator [Clostridiaceae bacterium]|nr:AraC family transcriptional regulator [Clostridiaceae bacterium]